MREPLKDRERLEHILKSADNVLRYTEGKTFDNLKSQVLRYISETNWDEWEKKEVVVKETSVHKSLIQTAIRMKSRNYDLEEICKITGLSREEIEKL